MYVGNYSKRGIHVYLITNLAQGLVSKVPYSWALNDPIVVLKVISLFPNFH